MLLLSIFLSRSAIFVSSFSTHHHYHHHHQPSTIIPYGHAPQKSWTQLHAAKRRGGAMSRRKKPTIQNDADDDDIINSSTDDDDTSATDGKGFGESSKKEGSTTSSISDNIYSMPPLYDLAFGYRDYEEEVDFLLDLHDKHHASSSTNDLRILELAAGPARHSLAALATHPPSEVDSVVALDRSKDMVKYGKENADYELGAPGGGRRDDFEYVNGDMRHVDEYTTSSSSSSEFDMAWLLLGSMQHLLTNDDIIACLSSVHSVLKSGGTVVIELPHPRETFSMGECTRNGWTVPLVEDADDEEEGGEKEYGQLNIVWGEEGDEFDPVTQVRQFTVGLELKVNNLEDIPKDEETSPLFLQMAEDGRTSVREVVPMRLFTLQEIDALGRCAGFEFVAKYGALMEGVFIEDEDEAFRMVCVLRKS